jgi:hypothetical protein
MQQLLKKPWKQLLWMLLVKPQRNWGQILSHA